MRDPQRQGKIFTELGFTFVDDKCEGDCGNCKRRGKEKKTIKAVPFKER
jgi:hypothetical protein